MKAHPYVYICTHRHTKQFYIGYREANVLPASQDLPQYRTSNPFVRNNFEDFEWVIVAEFFEGLYAYDYEQNLIKEHFNNPLIINKQYRINHNIRFRKVGPRAIEHTEKIAQKRRGWRAKPDQKKNYSKGQKERFKRSSDSAETRQKKSDMNKGIYSITSPAGETYITEIGLKDFAATHGESLGVTYWSLFNAYRKSYLGQETTAKRKNINSWCVTRLDKI